jgi:hypothetical protein
MITALLIIAAILLAIGWWVLPTCNEIETWWDEDGGR